MTKKILDGFIGKAGDRGRYQVSASLILSSLMMGVLLFLMAGKNDLNEMGKMLQQGLPWIAPVQVAIGLYLWFSPSNKTKSTDK